MTGCLIRLSWQPPSIPNPDCRALRNMVPPPHSSAPLPPPPFPSRPGTSIAIGHGSEGVLIAKNRPSMCFNLRHPVMIAYSLWCDVGQVIRIDVLPDDVLLDILDFYVKERSEERRVG